jgi:UPF0755 protein
LNNLRKSSSQGSASTRPSSRKKKPSKSSGLRGFFWGLALALVLVTGAAGVGAYTWLQRPMSLSADVVDLQVDPGSNPRSVALQVQKAGVDVSPELLFQWFRLSGKARQIKAGSYELAVGVTPLTLLDKLTRGDEALRAVTFVEGWNIRQVRAALARAPDLKQNTATWEDDVLMESLGRQGVHPEGQFFPDTYMYAKGSSDQAVLARAMKIMELRLAEAWDARSPDAVVSTPQEGLILASIIEKETGSPSDRAQISAVFNNRLRIGMRLQTDPTVIYGLGAAFDGNLRKIDLQTDTPYNTYTRSGLPPSPIAMPGRAALAAAFQPSSSSALYFVARGDGSSHFSTNLDDHNRAVNQYIRGQ